MADAAGALIEEILADARRQAERITHKAEREADRIISSARQTAERERSRILEEAKQRADKIRRTARGITAQQIRAVRCQALEHVLEQVRKAGMEKVLELTETDDYIESLCALALAAMKDMAGNKFTVILSARDRQKWGAQLEAKLKALAPKQLGRQVEIEIHSEEADFAGGLRIVGSNGKEVCDQTFEARLKRLWPQLRQQVASILFGDSLDGPRTEGT